VKILTAIQVSVSLALSLYLYLSWELPEGWSIQKCTNVLLGFFKAMIHGTPGWNDGAFLGGLIVSIFGAPLFMGCLHLLSRFAVPLFFGSAEKIRKWGENNTSEEL
jgi:hypothetical protein